MRLSLSASATSARAFLIAIAASGSEATTLAVIERCYEVLAEDSNRIACTVKMDWRKGQAGRLEAKVESVENALGRKLRT